LLIETPSIITKTCDNILGISPTYIGYKLPTFQGSPLSPSSGIDDAEKSVNFSQPAKFIAEEDSVIAAVKVSDNALEKACCLINVISSKDISKLSF
jgi:hypothetical protein